MADALDMARAAATNGSCPAGCVAQSYDQERTRSSLDPESGTNPADIVYKYEERGEYFDSAVKDTCEQAIQDAWDKVNTKMDEFNSFTCPPDGKPTYNFDFIEAQHAEVQTTCIPVGNKFKTIALVTMVGGCANTNVLFGVYAHAEAAYKCYKQ